jgi:glycosyltransferase involved in cell wall biosynthesis
MKKSDLTVVVPVYNEEKNVDEFYSRVKKVISELGISYEIIFALDPSTDATENILRSLASTNKNIKILVFSRRFGQPAATMAGLSYSNSESCVIIDCDLQDPPELIKDLYLKFVENKDLDVIYAKRKSRKGETIIKKIFSKFGYFVINKFSDINIPRDTGDFRILSKRVVDKLIQHQEAHAFLRGMVAYIGFKQDFIEYERDERLYGKSKYNRFFGSLKIGLNGIFGFTSKPLIIMSITGFFLSFFSFLLGLLYLIQKIIGINLTPGLSTIVILITFFSGVQLLSLGLVGEYISRIYDEIKKRPLYIIDKKINFSETD